MFIERSNDDGQGQPFEYVPVTGGLAIDCGTALIVTGGKLALATGTNKPTYISMAKRAATTDGEVIAVQRVSAKTIFETELSEEDADIAIGEKHTISADGNKITATIVSGVAEIISVDGTAAGAKVRVRF